MSLVDEDPEWDVPHRVLAAAEYLRLRGEASGGHVEIVRDHPELVRAFVRDHTTQTNVVQRCWSLLPLFLTVGGELDLLELGCSAGLNLYWDRYGYEYGAGTRDGAFMLRGEERAPVPGHLLEVDVEVVRRRGVDVRPLDVRRDDDLALLDAFSFDETYRSHIRAAAEVLRSEPPELIRGDYVELLPELLADRVAGAVTVVFQTISTIYLPLEQRLRVRELVDRVPGVVYVQTPTPEEHGLRGWQHPLSIDGRIVAEMANGGEWLRWFG